MKKLNILVILLGAIFLLTMSYVFAAAGDPTGVSNLNIPNSSTFNPANWPAQSHDAIAGNITYLNMSTIVQTQTWQGYFGQITATITLDDANNNTMYDWSSAEPQGEIYASNSSSVTWANIKCVNYSANGSVEMNLTTLESNYGLNPNDYDGFDETFDVSGNVTSTGTTRDTPHPQFWVGTINISSGSCPAVDTYESDSASGTNFTEVLLTDNANLIFTTILEDDTTNVRADITGYNGVSYDFQMLVVDDGHEGDTSITTYYFFVELE